MNREKIIGKKASNLNKLERLGFNVPKFIVISDTTISRMKDDQALFDTIAINFKFKYGGQIPDVVSVRSSGSVSAAGRMKTILKVKADKENVINAFKQVRESVTSERLLKYLKLKGVKDFHYSIIVQEMVYGDMDEGSGSGVAITYNPYTDEGEYYTEMLFNSTGENLMNGSQSPVSSSSLKEINPIANIKLDSLIWEIKKQFKLPQEIEFVVQGSSIFILQVREFRMSTTILRNNVKGLKKIGQGKAVIPHSAVGKASFDKSNPSKDKVLITDETDFEDTESILNFVAVITRRGGRLSHAAIIANEFDLPCVVGANFDEEIIEGEYVLIDENGTIFKF